MPTSARSLPPLHATLALALVAGVLTVLGLGLSTPAGASPSRPQVGECRALTLDDIYKAANTTAPVDCAEDHTSRVVEVGRLPRGVDWSAGIGKLTRVVENTCRPVVEETLGTDDRTRAMSAYSYAWFMPTKAQRQAGARWFRCDLMIWGGKRLVKLPTDEAPALTALPHPDSVARCLMSSGRTTVCARSHGWRATGVLVVAEQKYPGDKAIRRIALRRCPDKVDSDSFWFTWSTRIGWKFSRTIVCYTKTSA